MKDYKTIKAILKANRESTRYFTKDFYNTYLQVIESVNRAAEQGIDPEYYQNADGVTVSHAWDPVYNTDFYNRNSCAYCQFLEIVNE